MRTIITTIAAALALAAPAGAASLPPLGNHLEPPASVSTVPPFTIYHVVGCSGTVDAFDVNGAALPLVGGLGEGGSGFMWADGDDVVVYDDTALQFVNFTHDTVIVAKWCSKAMAPAPAAEPQLEPLDEWAPEPDVEDAGPIEAGEATVVPATVHRVEHKQARRYRVKRCHRSHRTHRRVCFTKRLPRWELTRADRRRLHIR